MLKNRYKSPSDTSVLVGVLLFLAFAGFVVYGYVANLVSLFHATSFTGAVILRVIGIFVAPVGVVLGYM